MNPIMPSRPIAIVASLVLLAGCSSERAALPGTPQQMVQPPTDLIGTWTERGHSGFIAIGAHQTVVAMDGAPRIVAHLNQNDIESGMTAGRLLLDDGTALFVARGTSMVDGIPVDHLDVEVVSADGTSVRRRVLPESALRLITRMTQPVAAADPKPLPKPTAMAQTDPDADFIANTPLSHRQAAKQLVWLAGQGASRRELATGFADRQRRTYANILVLIEQSRSLPGTAAGTPLATADRCRDDAERFARAWRAWMTGKV
jgi:hypothetical protein